MDRGVKAELDTHDRMVRDQLRRFRGHEINTTGDGFVECLVTSTVRDLVAGSESRSKTAALTSSSAFPTSGAYSPSPTHNCRSGGRNITPKRSLFVSSAGFRARWVTVTLRGCWF